MSISLNSLDEEVNVFGERSRGKASIFKSSAWNTIECIWDFQDSECDFQRDTLSIQGFWKNMSRAKDKQI